MDDSTPPRRHAAGSPTQRQVPSERSRAGRRSGPPAAPSASTSSRSSGSVEVLDEAPGAEPDAVRSRRSRTPRSRPSSWLRLSSVRNSASPALAGAPAPRGTSRAGTGRPPARRRRGWPRSPVAEPRWTTHASSPSADRRGVLPELDEELGNLLPQFREIHAQTSRLLTYFAFCSMNSRRGSTSSPISSSKSCRASHRVLHRRPAGSCASRDPWWSSRAARGSSRPGPCSAGCSRCPCRRRRQPLGVLVALLLVVGVELLLAPAPRGRAAAARCRCSPPRSAACICRKKNVSSSVRMCAPSTSASVMMMILW